MTPEVDRLIDDLFWRGESVLEYVAWLTGPTFDRVVKKARGIDIAAQQRLLDLAHQRRREETRNRINAQIPKILDPNIQPLFIPVQVERRNNGLKSKGNPWHGHMLPDDLMERTKK